MLKCNYIQAQIVSDGDMTLNTIQYNLEPRPIFFFSPLMAIFLMFTSIQRSHHFMVS